MTHSNYILFEPLGVGETRVKISDSSGHSYILKVKMNSSSGFRAVQFAEDLKERFKTTYPNIDQVYTSQVIASMVVE